MTDQKLAARAVPALRNDGRDEWWRCKRRLVASECSRDDAPSSMTGGERCDCPKQLSRIVGLGGMRRSHVKRQHPGIHPLPCCVLASMKAEATGPAFHVPLHLTARQIVIPCVRRLDKATCTSARFISMDAAQCAASADNGGGDEKTALANGAEGRPSGEALSPAEASWKSQPLSQHQQAKVHDILAACRDDNHEALTQLAASEGGLVEDEVRRTACKQACCNSSVMLNNAYRLVRAFLARLHGQTTA